MRRTPRMLALTCLLPLLSLPLAACGFSGKVQMC